MRIGEFAVPWSAVALSLVLFTSLLAFAVASARERPIRADDLVYVVLGAVPGAVVGGRFVHGLVYLDAYAPEPAALMDLTRGSLSLTGAVVGGSLSAAYIAHLLEGTVRRWADAAAVPLLAAIGLGKLLQLLDGGGQGAPFDGPTAVALSGPGPWHSVQPGMPAHPAQVYEGVWTLLGVPLLLIAKRGDHRLRNGTGLAFVTALGWWLAGRFGVAFTWRDDRVVGALNAEQVAIAVVLAALALLTAGWLRAARVGAARRASR